MGCPRYLHFPPDSDRRTEIVGGLKRAKTGSDKPYSITLSARERRVGRRDLDTERFRRLEINEKQEFGGLLNRKLGRFAAFSEFDRLSEPQVEPWRESPARKKSVHPLRKASLQGDRR
jgi:hypothetical protein